jgi:hypothetical protein
MWPTHTRCKVSSVDLSASFRGQEHSFSGTSAQKLAATVVFFYESPNVDFLPKEILSEFPHLNGILIFGSNLPTVKNNLFTSDFKKLQFLSLGANKIQTIEPDAFQHLVNLKWIGLWSNQIQTLPFQLFKKNPDLFYINLYGNNINSISSDFFKNLNKLKYVDFGRNLCINKDFGCSSSTCSVTQYELNSALSTCYSNCKNNMECSLKSGKFEMLNPRYVEANIDSIVSYGHLDVLIAENYTDALIKKGHLNLMVENGFLDLLVAQNYLDPLIQNGHLDLLIEKNYLDLLIRNGYKNRVIESDWKLKLAFQEVEKLKVQMESENKALKQELADLKKESERREVAWKNQLDEIINKKLNDFEQKFRP